MPVLGDEGAVLVLYGDVPLIRANTLQALVDAAGSSRVALLTVNLADPKGYGRIVRDLNGQVSSIVEEKDASAEIRAIREVNTGILCAPAALLRGWLARLQNNNAQGEYYLTDVIAMAVADGVEVVAQQLRARMGGAGGEQQGSAGRTGAHPSAQSGRCLARSRRDPA